MARDDYIQSVNTTGIWASSNDADANLNVRPGEPDLVFEDGYEENYSEVGGANPTRSQHNYLFRIGTAVADFINRRGVGQTWRSSQAYDAGADIVGSDGNEYKAVQASTGVDPVSDSDSSHWVRRVPDAVVVPSATMQVSGTVQIATQAQADAGTNADVAMPPDLTRRVADARARLAAPDATNTVKGIIEIASDAEATAGTLEDKSINPKQLSDATPDASTTQAGLAQFATDSDVQSAIANRVVTASGLPIHKVTVFTGATPPASTSNIVEFFIKIES